ncbi:MAG: type VI secretion system baseplate subunit TssK [Gammaproteobacteria bacterium]|nr:type VI secretion system baseplate subunit TssK [Gammaproteobacteria bacterium]
MMDQKVIWYEGMALEPQHFQQQTRYIEALVQRKLDVLDHHLWGFTELTVDTDLFAMGKLGIASAKGIFPDGTIFNMPASDDVPIPLAVPEGLTNTILYLALPINHASVADAGDENSEQLFRYRTVHRRIRDNIADSGEETDLSVGSLACRILTEQDDRDGYLCLPMLRIKEVRSNQQIKLDKAFIPVWLNMHQSAPLVKFLEEVSTLLTQRAEMLSNRFSDTQQADVMNMVDLLLLQLSNKYEAIFGALTQAPTFHPRYFHTLLVEMLAEMATYTNDRRRPVALGNYQHDNLYETFKPVIQAARKSLSVVLEQNAVGIALLEQGHGLWFGVVDDHSLFKTCSFVLAVYADLPLETIRTSFPAQIKVAPVEQIRALVSRSLPGIAVHALAIAPRQIPHHPNFCYFAINNQGELWEALSHSANIALHISGDLPALKLELWAIKG